MKIEYKTNKLRKQLSDASEIKKNFGVNAARLSGRLDDIQSSPTLAVLMQIPQANCHPLKGDRKGQWGVDISKNFRIIFELDHDPIPVKADGGINVQSVIAICILEIGDYH